MQNLISGLPSPLEILLDPLSLIILGIYSLLILWEAYAPARPLPFVKYWKIKGLTFFILFFYVASYLPLITDPYLIQFQLIDLSFLGTLPGALVGLIIYELGLYFYHITMHKVNFLWRTFHQLHHSAERLDTFGALFHSPLDMVGFTLTGSLCLSLLVGLSPASITIVLLIVNFLAFFQHANIQTPRWIGYIIQRPESHSIHHGRAIHQYNYADLPLIDIFFGTFRNPKTYQQETGFYDGASSRIIDMLKFRDVSKENQNV